MAIKFDFNKLRTAIKKFTTGVDTSNGTLSAGEQAKFAPHMQIARPVEEISNSSAVTRTLTTAESGTLFAVSMAAVDNNVTITLPTAANSAGVYFDFCFTVDSDDDADFILTTGLDATDIFGGIISTAANDDVDAFNGVSKITVDGSVAQSAEGLRLGVLCDGVNWHLQGQIPTAIATVHLVGGASA
tara:strand:- start:26332 stop:26892 length:561 start_codon:yes stop_codon:yes gene_type:complete